MRTPPRQIKRLAYAASLFILSAMLVGCGTRAGYQLDKSATAAGEGKIFNSLFFLGLAPISAALDTGDVLINGRESKPYKAIKDALPERPSYEWPTLPTPEPYTPPPPTRHEAGPPPSIVLDQIAPTTEQIVDVHGTISSQGKIVSATINGTDISIGSNGEFLVHRGIALGQTELELLATDEWGQTGSTAITVTRTISSVETQLPLLSPSNLRGANRPNAIAIIIGIEKYESAPIAEFAESDARSFYDYAANSLGVPTDRIKLLVGTDARRINIRKALLTWAKPLIVRDESDVYVFFSGHGMASDDGRELYLIPYDGDRTLLDDSSIRRKEIVDLVVSAGAASTTLFLDTCYSGDTRSGEPLAPGTRPIIITAKTEELPLRVTMFSAAANNQLSSSLGAARHGLFSYYLMKGLEGAAAGPGNVVTASALQNYLLDHIPTEAAKLGRTQDPQLSGDSSAILARY